MLTSPRFTIVLRGYDRHRVDALVARTEAALASADPAVRADARQELASPALAVRLRGYDRSAVERYLAEAVRTLAAPPTRP